MEKEDTQLGSTANQRERTVNSIIESKDIVVTREWTNLRPANLGNDSHCHTPNNEYQRANIGIHNKLHPLMVKECKNCGILTETNEFCFNLLESKLGNRTDGHLEKESMLNEKGPLRYFGKTLATCSKCENLHIHSLFSKHEENSSLRLNLGGFSPVLFHNIFKTCESKGNDIECRLVILGARPRSSPAYAVSNEHTTACPAYCQDCHYQSPNSHRSNHPELSYSTHQLRDYHPSTYEVSSDACDYQRDRSNAGSLYTSAQVPFHLDTPDDCSSSAPSTRQLSNESNARIKKLISPSSQNTPASLVCSIVRPTPNEIAREMKSSTPRSGGQVFEKKSPAAGAGTLPCESKKYPISSQCENEAVRSNASAFSFDVETSISNIESKSLSSSYNEVYPKAQNKRVLNTLDEKDCPTFPKKSLIVCSLSNTQNVNEISVKDTPVTESVNLDYSQPSASEAIIKSECSNVSKSINQSNQSIPIPEETLGQGITESLSKVQPSVMSLSSKSTTSAAEAPVSGTAQIDHVARENYLRKGSKHASQIFTPKYSDKPEARRWKPADFQEAEIANPSEKTDINVTDLKAGNEEKNHVPIWSNENVVSFLIENDYSEYADVFKQEEIDGQALLLLDEEKLHSLLGIKMGPAMKIARHIRNLQASLSYESDNLTGK